MSTEGLGNTFSRAWDLLSRNWIIIVPAIVVAIVAGIIVAVLGTLGMTSAVGLSAAGAAGAGIGSAVLAGALIGAVLLIASIITLAYTTGMASAAWSTGIATLSDGAAAFREDAGSLIVAAVSLFILGVIAVFLAVFTFGLSLLAFWLFFIYTFAGVVVGNRSGTEAIGESARMTLKNFPMTLAIVVLLFIASVIAGLIGNVLHAIPFVGSIVSFVIQQIVAAYATLVIVGEYINLRQTVEVQVPPRSPG